MGDIKAVLKGVKGLSNVIGKAHAQQIKASENAIKIEGYRLRKLTKAEIKSGDPGGKKFKKLSYMRMFSRSRRKGVNNPLVRLNQGIRYNVEKKAPYEMAIGFSGNPARGNWRGYATKHQEGFRTFITPEMRRYFARKGASLLGWKGKVKGKVTKTKIDQYKDLAASGVRFPFFIKKSTKYFKTPSREIIDPIYKKELPTIKKNISANYRIKMKGGRI